MVSGSQTEMSPAGTASGGELPAFTAEQLVLIDSMIAARLSCPELHLGVQSSGHPPQMAETDPLATAASSGGESVFCSLLIKTFSTSRSCGPRDT